MALIFRGIHYYTSSKHIVDTLIDFHQYDQRIYIAVPRYPRDKQTKRHKINK